MIPKLTASTIYSTLGNNSSLVPLAIKDIANSCGLTTASYLAGDEVEGKDRFIDEFGTQAIWLWGIPTYKKLLDLPLFKALGFDKEIDARILKNPKILQAAQDLAPTEAIKNSIKHVANNKSKFKALTIAKFAISTVLTAGTYLGLTKFRHKYTENQIKQDYYEKQQQEKDKFLKTSNIAFSASFSDVHKPTSQQNKKVSFTGGLQDFIFDPVKNLMLVDASITTERLTHARNPQDFLGYAIKEGSFWAFMYFAGPLISNAMEKYADTKLNKNISLDSRILESGRLQNAFKNGAIKKHLEEFAKADLSDEALYKFAVKPDKTNLIIDLAKKSGVITLTDDKKAVDTRKFINLQELREIRDNLSKLVEQQKTSGKTVDEFLKAVRKLKRASVITNIGACITALGIIAPSIMLLSRKNQDYQVKADIEQKLNKQNIS